MGGDHLDGTDEHDEAPHSDVVTAGFAYGVAAALGLYATVVILLAAELVSLAGGVGGVGARSFVFGTLGDWFGAHIGVAGGARLGVANVDSIVPLAYYVVPPALLVFWGRQAASHSGHSDVAETQHTHATLSGASIVLGYSLVAASGVFVLWATIGFSLLALSPLRTLLVSGVVYPVVLGGLGGYSTLRFQW